ncbi:alpha/beta hydrolase [Gordonia sp. VNK21]|uniref:alpha/beta hydrolase n=1 Tax=Gordonia sp. VNK21 TaxID=3382483 RepID=UPI0038D442A0
MVMAKRPEVQTASAPVTALSMAGLAGSMLTGLAQVPFRRPWEGPSRVAGNIGQAVTRQTIRSFMGYLSGLPIDEFRSVERVIDDLCRVVMSPIVELLNDVELTEDVIAGVPGVWCRARASSESYVRQPERRESIGATLLYLPGGGYVGTTPMMYSAFVASLVRVTGAEVFVVDYRKAPEYPFPAGVHDAARVYHGLLVRGVDPQHLVVAGDSGGGGLAVSLIGRLHEDGEPMPAGMVLFSPQVDLVLDYPSITENAPYDVLPWNIPVTPYLKGISPDDERVSPVRSDTDPEWFPPTLVSWGRDEMFRDGIADFVARLADAGVDVIGLEEPGMFHVYPILMPWAEASVRTYREVRDFTARTVAPDPSAAQTH